MTSKKIISIIKENLILLIILLLFSYDLLTYLPQSFTASIIKIIYYSLILFFYIVYFLIIQNRGKLNFYAKDITFKISVIFCFAFLFRLLNDLYIDNIYHFIYANKFTYIFIYFNCILIPLFVLRTLDYSKLDFNKLYIIYTILILFCLIITFTDVIQGTVMRIGSSRISANSNLDTIAYGHLGISLFLLGFAFYVNSHKLGTKIISVIIIIFGLFSAGLANSRSPIVSLIACIFFYIINEKKFRFLVYFSVSVFLFVVFIDKIDMIFRSFGSSFVERILFTFVNIDKVDVTSNRSGLYSTAIDIISNNPVFGSSFLIQKGSAKGFYVHNFVLEAFMSLGLLGGFLYITLIFVTVLNAFKLSRINKKRYLLISLIFIQYLVYSMFSRSIISLPTFWVALFLVNSILIYEKRSHLNRNHFNKTDSA